jgi:hypothetical protein
LGGSLKRFLFINLGEAEHRRWQLFEPEGRVLTSLGASCKFIRVCFTTSGKGFGQQPVKVRPFFHPFHFQMGGHHGHSRD